MCDETPRIDFEALAQQKTIEFLRALAGAPRRVSNRTWRPPIDGDPAAKSYHEIIFCYPGLEAITVYRLAHELLLPGRAAHPAHDDRVRPLARPASTSIPAPASAAASSSTTAPASSSARPATSASNVKLYQGVTLGALSASRATPPATSSAA